jgi:hypothetical protein
MGVFDAQSEVQHSNTFRYAITGLVFVVIAAAGLWFLLRFHTEKVTVKHLLDALAAQNMKQAYQLWKPSPSYGFKDFEDDWGANGYYGPVKSYRMKDASYPRKTTRTVIVVVDVSPFSPFPPDDDVVRQSKTKEVTLWVSRDDQSISFPPD